MATTMTSQELNPHAKLISPVLKTDTPVCVYFDVNVRVSDSPVLYRDHHIIGTLSVTFSNEQNRVRILQFDIAHQSMVLILFFF